MRVSFGKRIGGIYCGISKNISGATGVIIALFAMCVIIPIVASFYLLYYFFKGVIWCIKKINEATSEWKMLHRILLWTGIILLLLLIALLCKPAEDKPKNNNTISVSETVKTTTALKAKKTTKAKTTKVTQNAETKTTTTTKNEYTIKCCDISFKTYKDKHSENLKYDNRTEDYICWHEDNCAGSISLRTLECDSSDNAQKVLESEIETYNNFDSSYATDLEVNGVKITKVSWRPTNFYSNTYIFEYNNTVYIIGFSASEEYYEECSAYTDSDDIINTLTFKGKTEETTETETDEVVDEQEEKVTEVVETEAEVVETDPPTEEVIEETEDPNESITVYKTGSGQKYHYENPCGNGTYYECTLAEALRSGLLPCEKCVLH